VSEAIFHRPMVRQRLKFRIYPSVIFLTNRKIAPRRGTRPRLRIEDEGAAAPSFIPGELTFVF
ncbi:MAG: hypothetical protein ACI4XW_14185, partial [Candidatus Spyradocola sp.]